MWYWLEKQKWNYKLKQNYALWDFRNKNIFHIAKSTLKEMQKLQTMVVWDRFVKKREENNEEVEKGNMQEREEKGNKKILHKATQAHQI